MEALLSSEVSFWVLMYLWCPLRNTPPAMQLRRSVPSLRVSDLLLCLSCIFNLLPCCAVGAWGRKGKGLFGVRQNLLIGEIFCFGVVCLGFFTSIQAATQTSTQSDGKEIQCLTVTTRADRTFMWPLIFLLHGILRTDFLLFVFVCLLVFNLN